MPQRAINQLEEISIHIDEAYAITDLLTSYFEGCNASAAEKIRAYESTGVLFSRLYGILGNQKDSLDNLIEALYLKREAAAA